MNQPAHLQQRQTSFATPSIPSTGRGNPARSNPASSASEYLHRSDWVRPAQHGLDALATSDSPSLRRAVAEFIQHLQPPFHCARFQWALTSLRNGLALLQVRHRNLAPLAQPVTIELDLLIQEANRIEAFDLSNDRPIKSWSKEAPCYAALATLPADDEDRALVIAAWYVLRYYRQKTLTSKGLIQRLRGSPESLVATTASLVRQLQVHSGCALVDPSRDFQSQATLCLAWRAKSPGANDRHGLVHDRCLTKLEFEAACTHLSERVSEGCSTAVAVCVGWFSGLTWPLVKSIPIREPSHPWTIWLDLEAGGFRINLTDVVRSAAEGHAGQGYIPAVKEFLRPLPEPQIAALRTLAEANPMASDLAMLTRTHGVYEESSILGVEQQVKKTSIARLYRTRASACKRLGLGAPMTALAVGEFSGLVFSRLYYHCASQERVNDAVCLVAAAVGWGTPRVCAQIDGPGSPSAIGSTVTPTHEAIRRVGSALTLQVRSKQPPKRYRWQHIRHHHNAMAHLTAFILSFCLMGRVRKETRIEGALHASSTGLVGLHDKRTIASHGVTSVALCRVARAQLQAWLVHLRALIGRLDRLNLECQALRQCVQDILEGRSSSIVFVINENDLPNRTGAIQAYQAAGLDVHVKADSARHFWESCLSESGIHDTLIDAQARRQGRWQTNWSSTTSISGTWLLTSLCAIQDRVLEELGIEPVAGLTQ